jgi:hypothetical protein
MEKMKAKSDLKSQNDNPAHSSNSILIERGSRLSLSQQAQLAGDALVVSNLLELINDIENKPESTKEIDSTKVDSGINVIERLQRGEDYLDQRKTSLIPRPESADTVGHIRKRTGLQIKDKSEVVLTILNELKNWPHTQAQLNQEKLAFTKHFLRDLHTGIMDHLETSDELDLEP